MAGEPFLNKNLAEYIEISKNIGFEYVYIITNGALANLERVEPCIKAGVDNIKFSINGYDRDTYTYTYVHGKDDFEDVIKNLKNIYVYRETNNLDFKIYVSTILIETYII